jgi:O-antigen ligase
MCVIPFLQPRHYPPLRTFYDEWFAFALGTGAIAMAAAVRRDRHAGVPGLAFWLVAFALVLALRAVAGQPAYLQGPLLWAIYALFAGLLIALGHDLAAHLGRERVCDALAAFLLAGASLNAVAGILQVMGIPRQIDDFVSYLHGARAIGNIGQANLYANYLALGQASLAYLIVRGRMGWVAASAMGLLLTTGAALAGSRSSILFAVLFVILGCAALYRVRNGSNRTLAAFASILAIAGVALKWVVPAGLELLGISIEGGIDRGSSADWASDRDESLSLRILGLELGLRLFANAPWFGVGPGEFAGAAFALGLPSELAANSIWTSPHNLVVQLLAETGIVGALVVCAGLWTWARRAVPAFLVRPDPAGWWLLACTGIGMIHALLEYPLWYAHFLALTALIMGIGAPAQVPVRPAFARTFLIASAIAGSALLAVTLRDYLRFDLASPVFAGRSLASDAEIARDRNTLRQVARGLLAQRAELWLFLAFPLDGNDLPEKLLVGERQLRTWPARDVVLRQCIFLALAGRDAEARQLLAIAMRTFANRHNAIRDAISAAPEAARAVLRPVLQRAD